MGIIIVISSDNLSFVECLFIVDITKVKAWFSKDF